MHKGTLGILVTLVALASLAACESKVSIQLEYAGESVFGCDEATVSELTPKPGGWAFKCAGGGSAYFIYETGESPRKGKLKRIDVTLANGENRDMLPSTGTPQAECTPAGTGIDAFPTSGDSVEPGKYAFDLEQPCGSLNVEIVRK